MFSKSPNPMDNVYLTAWDPICTFASYSNINLLLGNFFLYLFNIHYGIWKVQNFIISCRNWAFVHWLYWVFHFITLLSVIYTYEGMLVESFRPWWWYIFYDIFRRKKSMRYSEIKVLVPSLLYYIWYSHSTYKWISSVLCEYTISKYTSTSKSSWGQSKNTYSILKNMNALYCVMEFM